MTALTAGRLWIQHQADKQLCWMSHIVMVQSHASLHITYALALRFLPYCGSELHYNYVKMSTMASQITNLTIVYTSVYSGADQKNIKAPRRWPLWGEFTGDRWIPQTKASNAESICIWWRHHGMYLRCAFMPCCGFELVAFNHVLYP